VSENRSFTFLDESVVMVTIVGSRRPRFPGGLPRSTINRQLSGKPQLQLGRVPGLVLRRRRQQLADVRERTLEDLRDGFALELANR
jgi:hypothetical protein